MDNLLQDVLYDQIPLTQSIGIEVCEYSNHTLTLTAPLANNINHKQTAFGGSLYSVCVINGWGLLYLLLKEHHLSGHIVIQESTIKFLKPVTCDIKSTSTFNSHEQSLKFLNTFKKKGKARITLLVKVMCNSEVSVLFEGAYVVHN